MKIYKAFAKKIGGAVKASRSIKAAKQASQEYIDDLLRRYDLDLNNYHGNVGDHLAGFSFIEDRYGNWDFSDNNGYAAKVNSDGIVLSSTKRLQSSRSIKASTDNKADVIAVLSDNGFERSAPNEPWWDKYMWLGFGCTYDMDREDAYVWWNPDGNMEELPYEYSVKTVQDAKALCDDLYNWDEYGLDDLLAAGLPLKGAKKIDTGVYEYSDGDDTAYIDIDNYNGYIIDAYGDRTDYSSLQDLLEEIGIIR